MKIFTAVWMLAVALISGGRVNKFGDHKYINKQDALGF